MIEEPQLELDVDDLATLRDIAKAATHGPWKIHLTEHPHHRGGSHKELTIDTAWDHGQLKAPYPVVTTSVGLGREPGGPGIHMVAMRAEDANHIASFNPAVTQKLLDLAERALAPQHPAPTIWRIVTGHGTHYRDTPPPADVAHMWEGYTLTKPSSPFPEMA